MTSTVSPLPQNLLQLMRRQPLALSIAASLGLHGVVWMTSPFINFEDSMATGPLTVDVVQLSPDEQNRLPQDSTALFNPTLSPLTPDPNSLGALPPLPALPPPPSDIFGTLPPLQTLSALSSIPTNSDLLPPMPMGELPPPPTSTPLVTVNPGDFPPITPVPLDPSQIGLSSSIPTLPGLPPATIPQLPPLDPGSEPNLIQPNTALLTPRPETNPPGNTQPETTPLETTRPIPQAALDHLRELQRLKAQNPGSTLDPSLPQQAQDWLARAGNNTPKKLILDNYRYPKSACPAKGYATVTVSVDGQGAIARAEITKSSGVPALDEIALKAAKAHTYDVPSDGQAKAYWLPFDFDPSTVCSGQPPTSPISPAESAPNPSPASTQTSPVVPKPPASKPSQAPVLPPPSVSKPSPSQPSSTTETSVPPEPKSTPSTSPSPEVSAPAATTQPATEAPPSPASNPSTP